jgi:hypothetical protein
MNEQINLGQIYHLLGADLRALNTLWNSGQNEMGRRVFATFVFSTFESIGWLLVNYVNEVIGACGKGLLTDAEIASAKHKESSKETNPVEHINFALRYAARFHGIRDFAPGKVLLWQYVEPSRIVRDRVVHPKSLESLNVTVEEQIGCKCALVWLFNCLDVLQEMVQNPGDTFSETLERLTPKDIDASADPAA